MSSQTSRRWLPWAIAGGVLIVALGIIGGVLVTVMTLTRPDPEFVSLALVPDPSLSGTVAYFDDESLCVRVVAAAGQPNREVYCVEPQDPAAAEKDGKDVGVDIQWLTDDRLQLTSYRMVVEPPDPVFAPSWQRIVDIQTGEVEEVPPTDYAGTVPQKTCMTTSPTGQELITRSEDGHAVVTLIDDQGQRTLLDVRGNPETYRISEACWAPNFQWVATSDTRLLVITTDDPPVTRTLTPPLTSTYGYDELSWFAITSANLLARE